MSVFDGGVKYDFYYRNLNRGLRKFGPVIDGRGKMQPIEPNLTSYWARHSWATYASELDITKDTISECLGHQYGSRITSTYIHFSQKKIDEANRKVLDYVFKGVK